MDRSGQKFAGVVYNPVKISAATLTRHATDAAVRHGWDEPHLIETSREDPGGTAARTLVDQGAALVVVAGGDGTVRHVASALRGTGVRMGIIPAGTGNLLARNLGLPLYSTARALDIALTGADRPIDLGVAQLRAPQPADDRASKGRAAENTDTAAMTGPLTAETARTVTEVFTVMAGMGIDAEMLANTNDALKKSVGWLAYVDAAVRSFAGMSPFRIRYQLVDTAPHSAHVSSILVANCGTLQAGIELFPDAVVDDGELDVAVLQPKGVLGWLQVWRKMRWENGFLRRFSVGRRILTATEGRDRTVTYLRSGIVTVRPDDPQEIELDGDGMGPVRVARFTVDPGSLIVRVRS